MWKWWIIGLEAYGELRGCKDYEILCLWGGMMLIGLLATREVKLFVGFEPLVRIAGVGEVTRLQGDRKVTCRSHLPG